MNAGQLANLAGLSPFFPFSPLEAGGGDLNENPGDRAMGDAQNYEKKEPAVVRAV